MDTRRSFMARALGYLGAAGLLLSSAGRVWARARRRILGSHVKATDLLNDLPRNLDTRNLKITPLEKFGTMGSSDIQLDPKTWCLEIGGLVAKKLSLSLEQLKARPVLEKKVLLICPGVFSYYARWKGLSLGALLTEAGLEGQVDSIEARGPRGQGVEKLENFPLKEVLTDQVFLAYEVNGTPLPVKHGFPLRIVATDHYGDDWVKYLGCITAVAS